MRAEVDISEIVVDHFFNELTSAGQKELLVELFSKVYYDEVAVLDELYYTLSCTQKEQFLHGNIQDMDSRTINELIENMEDLDLINEIERRGYTVTKDKEDHPCDQQ